MGTETLMGARLPLVAMLVAAEVAIVGFAIYSFGFHGNTVFAAGGFHRMNYTAPTIAPLAVGSSPRIAIDDPSDRVYITASSDRSVHVVDRTEVRGLLWGTPNISPLKVERTADGISITRSGSSSMVAMGYSDERIDVQVPSDAILAIARCGGADIAGVTGGITARSVDGSILLADAGGAVDLRDDDGRIEARRVTSNIFAAHTDSGRIILDTVVSPKIEVSTNDGRIVATLAPSTDVTVAARTNDGRIYREGSRVGGGDTDSQSQTFSVGSGSGSMSLVTNDGNISIFTNGAK
ncbi:MAG: DUF4097 family beta strand repeat-containing protein [Candidatus Eremiobacteraeota bacterium]|nr:DUF4097 family beta strand repeat-containing protein [Candidatus Eremiobacteraeota bacterium]